MRCLRLDEIYLYLEEELSSSETKKTEDHLASCPKCQKAVEKRKILLQASKSLPLWETPPDFTRRVMERIFPERVSLRKWLTATGAGFLSIILSLLVFFLLSGQNLANLLISLGHTFLDFVRALSVFSAKFLKVATLLVRIITRFARILVEGFAHLTAIISPEVQIFLMIFTLILSLSLFFGVRRKLMTGEKA